MKERLLSRGGGIFISKNIMLFKHGSRNWPARYLAPTNINMLPMMYRPRGTLQKMLVSPLCRSNKRTMKEKTKIHSDILKLSFRGIWIFLLHPYRVISEPHLSNVHVSYRSHYQQAPSSPSSWTSEPPSSTVRTATRSLPSKQTQTNFISPCSSSHHLVFSVFLFIVPSGLIWGSNFSDVTSLRSSGRRLHTLTPSAEPAAIAAPSAVVSGMDGFTEKQ